MTAMEEIFLAAVILAAAFGSFVGIAVARVTRRRAGAPRETGAAMLGGGLAIGALFAVAALHPPTASDLGIKDSANRNKCVSNLKQIGLALSLYQERNGGELPDADGTAFVSRLYESGILADANVYLCPSSAQTSARGPTLGRDSCSYSGRRNRQIPVRFGSRTIVAADRSIEAHVDVRSVLFADGHVERVLEETFQTLYAPMIGE